LSLTEHGESEFGFEQYAMSKYNWIGMRSLGVVDGL